MSKNNAFEEAKTGSSYNNDNENMQDFEDSDVEDSKKCIYEDNKTQRILLSDSEDKPVLDPDPEPSLERTSELLKNLQDVEEARRSKAVADAAAANMAGNNLLRKTDMDQTI